MERKAKLIVGFRVLWIEPSGLAKQSHGVGQSRLLSRRIGQAIGDDVHVRAGDISPFDRRASLMPSHR
jgi:Tfp pilus assembly protein PilZ